MSRSIAAKVLANAKKQEAEAFKEAKRKEAEALKKAKEQEKECRKKIESEMIAVVQEDMDAKLKDLEEWNHTTEENSRVYQLEECSKWPADKVAKIAQGLGFICEWGGYQKYSIYIPMWKKGEKKTTAQLMLYHHQRALKSQIKKLKEEAKVAAKSECQKMLEKGEYTITRYEKEYMITVVRETERRRIPFYIEQVLSIMAARGFNEVVFTASSWLIYMPKDK